MKCPQCNNEMQIAASFLQSRKTQYGKTEVCSVVDLMCTDPQCPSGKKKIPAVRQCRRASNLTKQKNAVSCCGEPLVYLSGSNYWVPDGNTAEISADGAVLSILCKNCGKEHTVETGDKTGKKQTETN